MTEKDIYDDSDQSKNETKITEAHYRRLFETAKDGILIIDADTGKVIDVNPFLTEILGYPRQEIVNKPVWELGFLKHVFSDKNKLVELQQKGFALYQDLPLKTALGDLLDIELTGSPYDIEHQKLVQLNFRILKERKEAEFKLEESEQRFRQLIEEAPIGIALSQHGKTVYANSGYLKMFGFETQEEIVGTSFLNQIAPESRVEVIERAIQHERGLFVKTDYDIQGLRKDGTQFPFQASINRVELANGPGLIGYFTDITDRQKAEKEIAHIASFPELNPNPIIEIDLDGTIIYANPATRKVFPDLISLNTLHPYLAQWRNIMSKLGMEGADQLQQEVEVEGRYYRQTFQYLGSLNVIRIYGNDITESKRAEEIQLESEEKHRIILQTAMDGFWLTDIQGKLLEVNETYCRMSGYSEQELLAMRISDLESDETNSDVAVRIKKIIAKGEDRFETRHRRKDGTTMDVEVSVQYQTAHGGRL